MAMRKGWQGAPMSGSRTFLFTSESVGDGHPDKVCDQISDAILDEHLAQDKGARVAVETVVSCGSVLLCGEVTSKAAVDYACVARRVLQEIGYDSCAKGLDYKTVDVVVHINEQSREIADAMATADMCDTGAGDQGIMFGYASDETAEKMPLSLLLAHGIVSRIGELRRSVDFLWPDCKSQVTVEYMREGGALVPVRVHSVVVSAQHSPSIDTETLRSFLIESVVKAVIPARLLEGTDYYVQPSGRFVTGGPAADAGLTGRKIIVDSYGGFGCHGGGSFSGKDWSKVDRSGAYMARWIAKSLVASGICRRVLVQVSYAIGVCRPLSVHVDTYGTGVVDDETVMGLVVENFDMRPGAISLELGLDKPIFRRTAVYGHFGRPEFAWEVPKDLRLVGSTKPGK